MKHRIKVLIADDHPIFRRGLASLIEADKNMELIGEVENGQEVLQVIAENKPDVVILDIDMPVLDGIETARWLQKDFPEIKTVFLTMHKDRQLLDFLNSLGVKGYVVKDSAVIEVVECIKTVFADKLYLSPSLSSLLLDVLKKNEKSETELDSLTATEKRVLLLITEGKTNREISGELFVSVRTIESHRFNICKKLKITGNHALFKFAVKHKEAIQSSVSSA